MIFIIIVLLTALLIEGIGTYVSVVGLSALFSANLVIITLAVALDVGKVVSVSFLHRHWKQMKLLMKAYMLTAVIVLMTITSTGAFGYLSMQFQKAMTGTQENAIQVASMTEERDRLQSRKEEIDSQISAVKTVVGKRSLTRSFNDEITRINSRLAEIDSALPALKMEGLHKSVETGPVMYVAEAFKTSPEQAAKWIILTIIFVFDPLAITLLIAGNFLIKLRAEEKAKKQLAPVEVVERREEAPRPEDVSSIPNETLPEDEVVASDGETPVDELVAEEAVDQDEPITEQVIDPIEEPTEEPVAEPTLEEPAPELNVEHEERGGARALIADNPGTPEETPEETVGQTFEEHVRPALEGEGKTREVITREQITRPSVGTVLDNVSTQADVIRQTGITRLISDEDRTDARRFYSID
jgi:hypothetical protein